VISAVMKTITAEPTAIPKMISSVCMRLSSRKRKAIFHSVHSESARRMRSVLNAVGDRPFLHAHALAVFGVADQHQITGGQAFHHLAKCRAEQAKVHVYPFDDAFVDP